MACKYRHDTSCQPMESKSLHLPKIGSPARILKHAKRQLMQQCNRDRKARSGLRSGMAATFMREPFVAKRNQNDARRLDCIRREIVSTSTAISIPVMRELGCRLEAVGLSSTCCSCCPNAKVCALLSFARCCLMRPRPRSQALACSCAPIST